MMAQDDLRTVRAQTAVVRALVDELRREGAAVEEAASLREQVMEESTRLVSTMEEVARQRSEVPAPMPPDPASLPVATAATRARVLIVDDDDASRCALARAFESTYEVVTAQDGFDGLAVAKATSPNVIITDILMPRMDGITMVARLREEGPLRHVPVIFVTGEGTPERVIESLATGPCSYWLKPLDLTLIASDLESVLSDFQRGAART